MMNVLKKIIKYRFSILFMLGCYSCTETVKKEMTLKEAVGHKFYIGTAMDTPQIEGSDTSAINIIKTHFNSVVAENCMKSEVIQPSEGVFDFSLADKFVAFGEANNMFIIGHTLVWHSQAPAWFFVDEKGNDVSRDILIGRMKNHISAVIGRYKGRVKGWDVVNEAILDNGNWRETKFYKIIGPEYIQMAFEFAHEADPEAELYYNDYSMANKGHRDGVVKMIKSLQKSGVPVDGIGMQTHCAMDSPKVSDFERSLLAFSNLGVKVMITEMDITVLPFPDSKVGAEVSASFEYSEKMNPYANGLPESVADALENRYFDFFKLFLKHHDKISRVTLWGVNDAQSWRNYWPIEGRIDYPLLFDRNYKAKPIVEDIIKEALLTK